MSSTKAIMENIKLGFVHSREKTKQDTEKYSKDIKDRAWKAGDDLLLAVADNFVSDKIRERYELFSKEHTQMYALFAEALKTFQNTFRLAEEGYYRSAFGELRDLLEIIMKMKLFYEDKNSFHKWLNSPIELFITSDIRKTELFKNSPITGRIEHFSHILSNNRHCSSYTLDANGSIITNVSYYRKDLFEKWCKHVFILKEIVSEIINIRPQKNIIL